MSTKIAPTDIAALFPISEKDMPKISTSTSRPNRVSLKKFQTAIQKNAIAISSRSNPGLGHLGIVVTPAVYAQLNNGNPFNEPVHPGNPVHANNATAAQITETNRQHQLATDEFQLFENTRTQLRNMITKSVDNKYISVFEHEVTGYNQCSPRELLDHLWATYGELTADDLTANQNRMQADWNPPESIESLFERMIEGQKIAADGGKVLDDSTLMRWSYTILQKTGLFERDLTNWRAKPTANKTWLHFQEYFTERDQDRRQNTVTSRDAGYANATQVQELVQKELANMMEQWVQEVNEEAPEESPSPPPTDSANSTIESLKKELEDMKKLISKPPSKDRKKTKKDEPLIAQGYDDNGTPITYCWSHGITQNLLHHSKSCQRKKEGHKDEATLHNKMGGCTDRCQPRPKQST